MTQLLEKYAKLQQILRDCGSAVVAFSGGVDSTFLLKVAKEVLGDKVRALTATSPTYPEWEFRNAVDLAAGFGVEQIIVESNELEIPGFAANPKDRCYHCKKELFQLCARKAAELGYDSIMDGSNVDDLGDYRPGRTAAAELGVRSPLVEAGLGKEEIRQLSKELGLPTWNKQPFACLASRFPYGTEISAGRLRQVERCEELLRREGFRLYRVRFHDRTARIELTEEEMPRLLEKGLRERVVQGCKEAGFVYVALDLQGYRTGSMNEGP